MVERWTGKRARGLRHQSCTYFSSLGTHRKLSGNAAYALFLREWNIVFSVVFKLRMKYIMNTIHEQKCKEMHHLIFTLNNAVMTRGISESRKNMRKNDAQTMIKTRNMQRRRTKSLFLTDVVTLN